MLTEAFKLAKEGKAVYVLATNSKHMYYMERMADRLFGSGEASRLGVKFETSASLPSFDFRTMQLKGAHPNCRVFVDHWAIESEYAKMLSELHRFDVALPEPTLLGEETTGPDPALLESMAMRYRHDFGLLDSKHQAAILVTMRQLWEEVVGVGFYRPPV
jgi:hypothetical protein